MNETRSLLVHIDAGPHGASRLQVACALCGRLDANLTALYAVIPVSMELSLLFTAGVANHALLDLDESRLAKARQLVMNSSTEFGVPIAWLQALDAPEYAFARQALYADLLVLGQRQLDQHDTGVPSDFVQSVLIASGKPALIVPHIGVRSPNLDCVFVAWKESREVRTGGVRGAADHAQGADGIRCARQGRGRLHRPAATLSAAPRRAGAIPHDACRRRVTGWRADVVDGG